MRVVWGLEARKDSVTSRQMFNTGDAQTTSLVRGFGNLEWRIHPLVLINAGGTLEHYSLTGNSLAPRLMANFQPMAGQTLRVGVSKAYRTPSLAEQKGDVRYYYSPLGTLAAWNHRSLGGLKPEQVVAHEIGYLGELRDLRLTLDARLYRERVSRILDLTPATPRNFINEDTARVRGLEYQAKWRGLPGTQVVLNQSFVRIASPDARLEESSPTHATTLFATLALPHDWDLSLAHHWVGAVRWLGFSERTEKYRRLDLRLAHRFRSGGTRGEVALTTQNVFSPYAEYRTSYLLSRRAFVSASLDF